jgi:hypothetical protein
MSENYYFNLSEQKSEQKTEQKCDTGKPKKTSIVSRPAVKFICKTELDLPKEPTVAKFLPSKGKTNKRISKPFKKIGCRDKSVKIPLSCITLQDAENIERIFPKMIERDERKQISGVKIHLLPSLLLKKINALEERVQDLEIQLIQ